MLEIKITGSTPLEALASITAFGLHCYNDPAVSAAANRILEAEVDKPAATAPVAAPVAAPAAPAPVAPDPEPVTPVAAPAAPESGEKAPKLEEVRAKGLEAARKHGQPAIKAILQDFGVGSMTNLAEGDRAAFLARLAELEGAGDGNA